jgi:hypothetical protein
MMSDVRTRTRTRPWWQELLISWLVWTCSALATSAFVAVAFGWTDQWPHNPSTFLAKSFVLSACFTAFLRWQRRDNDK